MRRLAYVFLACIVLPPAVADEVGSEPPRYVLTVLEALEGGQTDAHALNDFGYTTGASGSNAIDPGSHAFLGAPDGTIENIETLPCDISSGLSINSSRQVAGETIGFSGQSGVARPFRYTPGVGMIDLGSPAGGYVYVVDMNEVGTVVGEWREDGQWTYEGWVYTDAGGFDSLGSLGGGSTSVRDVNNAGQVAGYSWLEGGGYHAYVWEDGEMTDLGTLGGATSDAYYINDSGVIVGGSRTSDGTWRAFRYTPGVGMEPLPELPGMTSCTATWINNAGMITGTWWDGATQGAFFYSATTGMLDIVPDVGGTAWTGPVAMNETGAMVVVGLDSTNYQASSFYASPETGVHDLTDLLATSTDWRIELASDFNEAGQVIASAVSPTSQRRAVLLTPVQPGDTNCDGVVNNADIPAFVLALTDPESFALNYPGCSVALGDVNGDGQFNNADIPAFVELLTGN